MITKATGKTLAEKGIRVNSVNPGPVLSNVFRGIGIEDPEVGKQMFEKLAEGTPLKFLPTGNDIGYAVVFLANNRLARNITGTILVSDTGSLIDPASMGVSKDIFPSPKQ